MMINPLRGEFAVELGGERLAFDTRLGTIAAIEAACGDASIVDIINRCIFNRRASHQMALIEAALRAKGRDPEAARQVSAATSSVEAEGFVLALMQALGFELQRRPEAGQGVAAEGDRPLDGASAGGAGANSASGR